MHHFSYTYSNDDKVLLEKIEFKIDDVVSENTGRWSKHIRAILSNDKLKKIYGISETEKADDDDIDLFGDDDEDEMERLRDERAKEAAAKKKKGRFFFHVFSCGNGMMSIKAFV